MIVQVITADEGDLSAATREAIEAMPKRAGARRARIMAGDAPLSDEGIRAAFAPPKQVFNRHP